MKKEKLLMEEGEGKEKEEHKWSENESGKGTKMGICGERKGGGEHA